MHQCMLINGHQLVQTFWFCQNFWKQHRQRMMPPITFSLVLCRLPLRSIKCHLVMLGDTCWLIEYHSTSYKCFIHADIPSPLDVAQLREVDPLQQMSACLSSDILDAYMIISSEYGISLDSIAAHVTHVHRDGCSIHGSRASLGNMRREEGIPVHPIAPPPQTSVDPTPPPQPTLVYPTSKPLQHILSPHELTTPPHYSQHTFTPPARGLGHYTSLLVDLGDASLDIDIDHVWDYV